jgi:hypothetical protein
MARRISGYFHDGEDKTVPTNMPVARQQVCFDCFIDGVWDDANQFAATFLLRTTGSFPMPLSQLLGKRVRIVIENEPALTVQDLAERQPYPRPAPSLIVQDLAERQPYREIEVGPSEHYMVTGGKVIFNWRKGSATGRPGSPIEDADGSADPEPVQEGSGYMSRPKLF